MTSESDPNPRAVVSPLPSPKVKATRPRDIPDKNWAPDWRLLSALRTILARVRARVRVSRSIAEWEVVDWLRVGWLKVL